MIKKEMIAMLLAGGQGSRLGVLTDNVAKPAVSFGGKYRIIDFPLSNCINSGIDTVGVLTQYRPLRLNTHIGIGIPWDLDRNVGGVTVLPPYEKIGTSDWYTGTANAIYQNLEYMEQYNLNLQIVWTNLIPLFERWMYAGIPMVVLGALTWSFPKGSRQRFLMSVIYLAGSIVWLLYVLNFGDLTNLISVTYDDNTFELGMVLTFLLYLLVLFRALKILIVFGVYKDERNRYLEGE